MAFKMEADIGGGWTPEKRAECEKQLEQLRLNYIANEKKAKEEAEDKIQKAIFPTQATHITQPMDYHVSHKGLFAIDFGWWSDESLERLGLPLDYDYPIWAPFDCVVVRRDRASSGAGLALESKEKVRYANGDLDYCTVWVGHSNDTPALGSEFKQGEVVCHFGDAGASAKHMHLEVIKGKFSEIYANKGIALCQQSVGACYKLESTIEPYNALFLKKGTVIEDSDYEWKVL